MIQRLFKPLKTQSFFIFGARGTGKSTYLKSQFIDGLAKAKNTMHAVNLLEDKFFSRYANDPDLLKSDLLALAKKPDWVLIDEIQKIPKILDTVHLLIEDYKYNFILTGSSARKLKRGGANLLAGRAFDYKMHPIVHLELENKFDLNTVLNWGSLPKIFSLDDESRKEYLRSYCQTYLKEEILEELLVRNALAFRNFLKVAGQENGNTLNFSKIARDVGIDSKTAESYFQILEDTLLGFFLPAFHRSVRKSIKQQPKFYLFDLGVKKALDDELDVLIKPKSSLYGRAFEHFFIAEFYRLNSYFRKDFSMSHFQTFSGAEIDLILTKGKKIIALEIKSTDKIDRLEIAKLKKYANDLNANEIYYISQDRIQTKIESVICMHWQDFFKKLFLET